MAEALKEDALQMGVRLKTEKRRASETRTAHCLHQHGIGSSLPRAERLFIAQTLYESRYDGYRYDQEPSPEDLIASFCFRVFGASLEEVLQAYDEYLVAGD